MPVDIRLLGPDDVDRVLAAEALFDHPPHADWSRAFLESEGHHILIAYVDEDPVGFVSGVEMTHPDKGTEMFLYELAVHERYRRQGIGRDLVEALARLATSQGCYGMWVLTETANEAALSTYRSAGSNHGEAFVMLGWDLGARPEPGRISPVRSEA